MSDCARWSSRRYVGALKGHLSGVQEERSRKAKQGLNPDAGIAASTRCARGFIRVSVPIHIFLFLANLFLTNQRAQKTGNRNRKTGKRD